MNCQQWKSCDVPYLVFIVYYSISFHITLYHVVVTVCFTGVLWLLLFRAALPH